MKVKGKSAEQLNIIRKLSDKSGAGLLFSYKAWKYFQADYEKTLTYLLSDEFKRSIHKKTKKQYVPHEAEQG